MKNSEMCAMKNSGMSQSGVSYGYDVNYDYGDRKGNSHRQMSYSAETYNLNPS